MTIKLTVNDNFMYFLNESGLKRSSNTKKILIGTKISRPTFTPT